MYVEIGSGVFIATDEIVGIFDIDKTTVFKVNRNYLSNAQKRGKIINTTEKIPKSFVVCSKDNEAYVYISQFLPSTLIKRGDIRA